jgi:predicted component of type VI protein secretion system
MKFYLIVAKGSKKGMPIQIGVDLFLIGSDKFCQLRKRALGGKHCALITRDRKVFVRDLDSGHSTLVNGSVIPTGKEWPLHAGDRIEVGPLEFLVQFREHLGAPKDVEDWAANCLDDDQERLPQVAEDEESAEHANASDAAQSIIDKLQRAKGEVIGRLRIGMERGFTSTSRKSP